MIWYFIIGGISALAGVIVGLLWGIILTLSEEGGRNECEANKG